MSIPQVDINSFTIATQADTINQIAQLEGDLSTLDTTTKTNLVEAINELRSTVAKVKRAALTYALAMS
jgi:hypothetical protein